MIETKSPQEIDNRYRKAIRIAAHLYAHGIKALDVSLMRAGQWANLCNAIGVKVPSAETIIIIGEILATFEGAQQHMEREAGAQPVDLSSL